MFGLIRIYIYFNFYFALVKCNLSDDLRVRITDQKLIERKRQNTREMCKIFNSEALKTTPPTETLPLNKYGKRKKALKLKEKKNLILNKKTHRNKREINSINPALNIHDEERVETIVDKIYDDLLEKGQEVPYRRKFLPKATPKPKAKAYKTAALKAARRFPFAPHWLDYEKTVVTENIVEELPQSKGVRFPKAIVPYFIDSSTYDTHLAEMITKAFDYFEKATCIRLQRLRERPLDPESLEKVIWLYISNPSGIRPCVHSNERVEIQGVQLITFGYDCMSVGDISHEIMHVLGFAHEHLRPDRDQHITILWDNIKPGYKHYFEIHNESTVENLPYDYASVLHYPARAFSRNGKATILTERGIKIGQREALSELDVEKISILYSNECIKRNREYLLKTCPSVVQHEVPPKPVTNEEIKDYFRDKLWPYGLVTYTFKNQGEFTSEEKENIKAVIQHIKNETCVEFREISKSDKGTKLDDYNRAEDDNQTDDDNWAEDNNQADDDSQTDDNNRAEDNNQADDDSQTDDDKRASEDDDNRAVEDDVTDENSLAVVRSSSSYNFDTNERNRVIVLSDSSEKNDKHITDSSTSSELEPQRVLLKSHTRTAARKAVKAKINSEVKRNGVMRNDTKKSVKVKNASIGGDKNKTNIGAKGNYTPVGNKITTTKVNSKPTVFRKSRAVSGIPTRRHTDSVLVLTRSSMPGCPCPGPKKPEGTYEVKINADCFNTVNDLLHLFVHVLGLDHQHNMHDRDSYLHIVWDQLTEDIKNEMKKKLPPAASVGFPYDYQSVMHYPWLQIKDGKTNIMYPIWNDGWAMGQWQGLSTIDIQKIKLLYAEGCRKRMLLEINEQNKQDNKNDKSKENNDKDKENNDKDKENNDKDKENNDKDKENKDKDKENNDKDKENKDEDKENNDKDKDKKDEPEINLEDQEESYNEQKENDYEYEEDDDEQEEDSDEQEYNFEEQKEGNNEQENNSEEQEEDSDEQENNFEEQEEDSDEQENNFEEQEEDSDEQENNSEEQEENSNEQEETD